MKNRPKAAILLLVVLLAVLGFFWLRAPGNSKPIPPAKPLAGPISTANSSTPNTAPANLTSSLATNAVAANSPAGTNGTTSPAPVTDDGQLNASVLAQISALEVEKENRTPAQQKMDTQLIYADKMNRGVPIAKGVPTQRVDLDKDDQGRVLVDVTANVSDALLQYIESLGGKVINSFPQYRAIRAAMPLADVEDLAGRSEVQFVQPAARAKNNTVDSEGDTTHQAITARSTYGVNGSGVKVGVLSDSVDFLTNSQVAGLVTVLPGQGGPAATGEGTAMLDIVHDLAPGAQLYFATAYNSEASFASNIVALNNAGCNIIIDDVGYFDEPPFQDGIVAQAVNTVTTNGALYFSAAGNAGSKDANTSGTWEGDFSDGGATSSPLEAGRIHAFVTGTNYNVCTDGGGSQVDLELFWSDPQGGSANDYDLYVLNSAGTAVVGSSLNVQKGTQNPIEGPIGVTTGERIAIVKFSGSARFLHLSSQEGMLKFTTAGATHGHNCASNSFNVAATDANNSYPNPFVGGTTNPVETFSSDGPRRVFYLANGTAITPGNLSSTGGAVLQKPDITAADGTTSSVQGFTPFYGTSAAAPHAAAIAALLKSYNPALTAAQIRALLTNTALDTMAPGIDRDAGAGIVMAPAAVQADEPDLTRATDTLSQSMVHTGDTVTVNFSITNAPCSLFGKSVGMFHVGFYWSSSPTFSGVVPFTELSLPGCAANGSVSSNQNVTINAGNAPGTYYLGYKIDDENEVTECNEGNNGIFSWTVTVLAPAQPDLTRSSDSLDNFSPHIGDTLNPTVTITNQPCAGATNSGAFHVGFYWATNSSFSSSSAFTEISVTNCPANGSVSLNPNVPVLPSTPGTYYLGYIIDDENEVTECNEANNGIFFWTVTVLPPAQPDLTRSNDSLDNFSPHVGDTLNPTVTISNQPCAGGAANATAFHVGFYLSTNASFTGVVPFLETPVSGCPGGGTVSLNPGVLIDPATVPGTYYLGYNIDDQNEVAECNEGNNGIFSWTITVLPLPPAKAINPSPADGATGQPVNLSLSWADGGGATNFDVYLNGQFQGNQADTNFIPGNLMYAAPYTWRIDAKNAGGTTTGDTWSFSTLPPSLGVAMDDSYSNVLLFWPTNAVGFTLQNEMDLTLSNWMTTLPSPAIVNSQFTVTNAVAPGPMFYRLMK